MGAFALVQVRHRRSGEAVGRKDPRGLARALRSRAGRGELLAALVAGAECVHAAALGIGERVGNTQMDQMLVNLKLMGIAPWADQDLTKLKEYCQAVSQATGVPIPANYPVVGEDAFRTATGVHAAAVIKAYRKNDIELANTVYSGVPSQYFGMEQVIEIGPMSGKSNVHVLAGAPRHCQPRDEVVDRIYQRAKAIGPHADRQRNPGVRATARHSGAPELSVRVAESVGSCEAACLAWTGPSQRTVHETDVVPQHRVARPAAMARCKMAAIHPCGHDFARPKCRTPSHRPETWRGFRRIRQVHSAFTWFRCAGAQLADWQMEMASIAAPPFGEPRAAWLAERFGELGSR